MTSFLFPRGIRIFDNPKLAEPLRDRIRERAQEVCAANGVSIEHVSKSSIHKEALVVRVLAERDHALGLVHLLSAMGSCPSYMPCWQEMRREWRVFWVRRSRLRWPLRSALACSAWKTPVRVRAICSV